MRSLIVDLEKTKKVVLDKSWNFILQDLYGPFLAITLFRQSKVSSF